MALLGSNAVAWGRSRPHNGIMVRHAVRFQSDNCPYIVVLNGETPASMRCGSAGLQVAIVIRIRLGVR